MAQQSSSQQGGGGDNAFAPVWITVLLMIVGYLLWYYEHTAIVRFVFWLNLLQAHIVTLFMGDEVLAQPIYLMQTIDPAAVEWSQLVSLTAMVGDYVRYPVGVMLVIFAIVIYQSNIRQKYRKAHDMKSLRAQEQYNWPAIMPIVPVDLVSQDIDTGPWAMALSPMEFARKHQLLRKDDALLDNPVPGLEMTAGLRRGDAKRVFTLQLGPYWEGFERMPPHARVLCAVFMARMNRDRDSARHILEVMDRTTVAGKPQYSVADATIKKFRNAENVQLTIAKHAYMLTVMASLLQQSREDGVVPSSEFLWLKPLDRRMWYMLNSVGRQTPYVEVGGPFAHWVAERTIGRRCLVPMVEEAINALEVAIREIKLTPKQMQELKP
ncbi:IcmP protein [Legionella geestiana]|uniref:IcmP n=1 Tax=Legionella geestiana TaxID=45065 RepID=Q49J06_9GAMM|nr:type IVB secretion system coupling complex protein DotM/IcmP [Legionella geestiana]AAX56270.1 IcmP [Legionella geestiana]KTD00617.1 IcmP protein [Legionella geestiana]QBS12676.1 phosphoesterase [Legionella geestiana]STX54860.1 IcmP protein [Legionella geestiana]